MDNDFLKRYEGLKRSFKKETLDFLDSIEDPDIKDSDFLIADPQEQFIKDLTKSDDFLKYFF